MASNVPAAAAITRDDTTQGRQLFCAVIGLGLDVAACWRAYQYVNSATQTSIITRSTGPFQSVSNGLTTYRPKTIERMRLPTCLAVTDGKLYGSIAAVKRPRTIRPASKGAPYQYVDSRYMQ